MKAFAILDEREIWHAKACAAAVDFGYTPKRIFSGEEMPQGSLGFIRTHADQKALRKNQEDYRIMTSRGVVIQDAAQVEVYENKTEQWRRWGAWMPGTQVFTDKEEALAASRIFAYPIVSKANEGASSVNVRILYNEGQLQQHIEDIFAGRMLVNSCSGVTGRTRFPQNGYVFLQTFIPHRITWRVNAIGNDRAIFKRYCYRHKSVAQTGNVEPVLRLDEFTERLLEFSNRVFDSIKSRWCAIDVLHDELSDRLFLLETSLAWPWPSPGTCMQAPLFKRDGTWQRTWHEMWYSMFEQVEEGVWARPA